MKPAGCNCERREATETYTAEHVENMKDVPTIDASATSYGIIAHCTGWILESTELEKGMVNKNKARVKFDHNFSSNRPAPECEDEDKSKARKTRRIII